MLQALATPTTEQGWLHEYHEGKTLPPTGVLMVGVCLTQTSGGGSCHCSPTSSASSQLSWHWQWYTRRQLTRRVGPPAMIMSSHPSHSLHVGTLSVGEMRTLFSRYDLKRLELYSRNMADHHLITDLLPACEQQALPSLVLLFTSPPSLPPLCQWPGCTSQ